MHYLTLSGYVATVPVWDDVKRRWNDVLSNFGVTNLHMAPLNRRAEEYDGWSREQAQALLRDLINTCLTPNWGQQGLKGAVCTVNLDDYRRAAREYPALKSTKSAEAICVDGVVTITLALLRDDILTPTKQKGCLELFFDRNEGFQRTIRQVWEKKKSDKTSVHSLIHSIDTITEKHSVEIQVADFLSWHTNRYRTGVHEDKLVARAHTLFAAPSVECYFDYDKIVQQYLKSFKGHHIHYVE